MSLYIDPILKIPLNLEEELLDELIEMDFYISFRDERYWVLHDPKGRWISVANTKEKLIEGLLNSLA